MRVLVETIDSVGQTSTFVGQTYAKCATKSIHHIFTKAYGEFRNTFNKGEQDALRSFFSKLENQIIKGMTGPGDEVSKIVDGCEFHISFLADMGKHTGSPFAIGYEHGPITFQQFSDPWRAMENEMNMICQYGA